MAAIDPLRKSGRNFQTKSEKGDVKQSITLYDIDYAIMSYLEEVVLPKLEQNNQSITIPVIYGNSERWVGARRQGVYRDSAGKIQLPLMMIRRTSVAKNENMAMLNRHVSYRSITKYSKQNKYDRFSILGSTIKPKYNVYNITMPDYVEINYECMAWTNFTEHLNTVVESLTFASDEYWGDKHKFKFNTVISDYNIINEVGDGTERINRVEFNLNVKAYLLPEKFDGQDTIKKGGNITRVGTVITTETDVTANGRLESVFIKPSSYYDNKDLIDFLSLNNSESANPVSNNTITFTGVRLVKTPIALAGTITGSLTISSITYDVKVYINGVRMIQSNNFTATYSAETSTLTINFDAGNIGYSITSSDEVTITGKFIEL
jgi:hypothetical protein